MNVKDLDDKWIDWQLTGNMVKGSLEHKSSYHLLARSIIKQAYPTMQILEEVPIHPRKSETMYLDFYLPLIKKCIEVHGEQHYRFVPYYHHTVLTFLQAQKRDKDKREWCSINGIAYISLPYNEDSTTWKQKVTNNDSE